MSKTTPLAIRLSLTPEVVRALALAKKRYPTLSNPEILKLGLAKLIINMPNDEALAEIRTLAAYSLNVDGYLNDSKEDIYHLGIDKY
jgi:hypothetical protein